LNLAEDLKSPPEVRVRFDHDGYGSLDVHHVFNIAHGAGKSNPKGGSGASSPRLKPGAPGATGFGGLRANRSPRIIQDLWVARSLLVMRGDFGQFRRWTVFVAPKAVAVARYRLRWQRGRARGARRSRQWGLTAKGFLVVFSGVLALLNIPFMTSLELLAPDNMRGRVVQTALLLMTDITSPMG
ncbi:MAG: hypothetical protein OWU33_14360, partial [Firmicutes bacterium]|nr:hypothetical protein [Bacillota bacterium]